MGYNGYIGKDGTYYNTWNEMKQADVKWEQQDKQNRLIAEQNKLIKEQQARQEQQERQEQMEIAYQQRRAEFEYKWQTDIFPLMQEAGIKEPVSYLEKLRELYDSEPETEENLPLLNNTNIRKWNRIANYPTKIGDELLKIYNPLSNYACIIFGLILYSIIGLCMFDGNFSTIVIIAICFLFTIVVPLYITNHFPKRKREMNKKIEVVNTEIKKYNEQSNKEIEQWENKIKNYENKRLKNFNYLLEIALEELSIAESELGNNDINYRLQFNDYPSDYDKKKNEYLNKKNLNQAKENGTEDFLDL